MQVINIKYTKSSTYLKTSVMYHTAINLILLQVASLIYFRYVSPTLKRDTFQPSAPETRPR